MEHISLVSTELLTVLIKFCRGPMVRWWSWYHTLLDMPHQMHIWFHLFNISCWPWQFHLHCSQVSSQGSCEFFFGGRSFLLISFQIFFHIMAWAMWFYFPIPWGYCGLTCNCLYGNINSSYCLLWSCWQHMGHRGWTHNPHILEFSSTSCNILGFTSLYHRFSFDIGKLVAWGPCGPK